MEDFEIEDLLLDDYFTYSKNEKPLVNDQVFFKIEGVHIFGEIIEEDYDVFFENDFETGELFAYKFEHLFEVKLDNELGNFEILTLPYSFIFENGFYLKGKDDFDNRRGQFLKDRLEFHSRTFESFVQNVRYK